MSLKSLKKQLVTNQSATTATRPIAPSISGFSVSGLDDTALDPAGGQTVLINGTGFRAGAVVYLNTSYVSVVTFVNTNQLSFTSPALSAGTYTLFVTNTDGGTAILSPGLVYSTLPTWTTSSGSLGSYYETTSISNTVIATSDSSITYSLVSGSLPTGATLSSSGVITGTAPVDTGSTTYSFVIKATDTQLQDSTRSFSLTINTDVVSWTNPSSNTSVSLDSTAYSNTLSATSAAGYAVTYAANALPTGLSLSSGTISGTPTVEGTSTTLLTATAATSGRSSQRTITWTVALNDIYWKYNTTLLSANSSLQTQSFIAENSLNNSQITVLADAGASNFNPYQHGYYSTLISSNAYWAPNPVPLNIVAGTNFTIEFWFYTTATSMATQATVLTVGPAGSGAVQRGYSFSLSDGSATPVVCFQFGTTVYNFANTSTLPFNTWAHCAVSRSSTSLKCFINGVQFGSTATTTGTNENATVSTDAWGVGGYTGGSGSTGYYVIGAPYRLFYPGYISNMRIVIGTALYTAAFTPPTTPLTAITGTQALLAQSNRFIDNSPNSYSLSFNGTPTISPANPFITQYVAGTQYYSTFFNGSTDYLTTPSITLGSGDLTVELWLFFNNADGTRFDLISTSTGTGSFLIYRFTTNNLALFLANTDRITVSNFTLANYGNRWTHIAVVKQSNVTKMYINGVVQATTYSDTNTYGSQAYRIGNATGTSGFVSGCISNVRFVVGNAVYTGNFTVPTAPLASTQSSGTNISAITGTQTLLLTCQDSTFKDNSTNAYTLTLATTTVKPVPVSPFTPSNYSSTQITTYGSGYFDGTGDYLSVGTQNITNFGAGNFTMECWFYATRTATYQGLIESRPNATNGLYPTILLNNSNVAFWVSGAAAISSAFVLNTWYHVAVVKSGSSTKMYLNGVQAGSTYADTNTYLSRTDLIIGSLDSGGNQLQGYIADVRIVKGTALYTTTFVPGFTSPLTNVTNTQLLTLQTNGSHNNSVFKDNSGFNNIVTRTGNVAAGTFSPYGDNWSNYFDGTGDYISVPASSNFSYGTGDFTYEAWIYPTSYGSGTTYRFICGSGGASQQDQFLINNDGTGKLYYYDGTTAFTTTNQFTLNDWNHVAVSRSSGTLKIFINGTQGASGASSANLTLGATNVFYIGNRSGGADSPQQSFIGYISNLRVLKGTGLYTSNFTPSTSPLTVTSTTSLLTCQSNRLIDVSVNNATVTKGGDTTVQKFSPFTTVTVPKYYSTYFDGTGDYLSVSGNSNFAMTTGNFTYEAWIYPISVSGYFIVVGQFASLATGSGYWLFAINSANKFEIYYDGQTYTALNGGTVTLNTWQHVALVRNGSTITGYINGTSAGTITYASTFGTNASALEIGGTTRSGGNIWSNGLISNLRIVKGQALYTGSFTPSTSPLTAITVGSTGAGAAGSITGTVSLLTCQSNTFTDNSGNYYTVTGNADAKPLLTSPFTPTASTTTNYSPTTFGGSMYFDGTGDYLSATIPAIGTSSFTVECWVYATANLANAGIFQIASTTFAAANTNLALALNSGAGGIIAYLNAQTNISASVNLNTWIHFAVSRASGTTKIFLNGVQIFSGADSNSYSTNLVVGGYYSTSYLLSGYISDFRIILGAGIYTANFFPGSSPLTPTTTIGTTTYNSVLLLNGTEGGIIDASRTVDLETQGDMKVTPFSPYNGSYYSNYFDGTGDYLTVPGTGITNIFAGDFTLEAWLFPNAAFGASWVTNDGSFTDMPVMICNASPTSLSYYWAFGPTSTGTVRFITSSISYYTVTSTATCNVGAWNHLAVVKSGSTYKIYVNGVGTAGTTIASPTYSDAAGISIGANNGKYVTGYISNARLVKGTAVYTSDFTPSTTPLTAVTNTSLLTCQSNTLRDNSINNFTVTRAGDTAVKTQNPFQVNTGQSYYFDGTVDSLYAIASNNFTFGTGDFTVEFWLYFTATANRQDFIWISTTGAATDRMGIIWNQTAGNLTYYISPTIGNAINYAWTPTAGQWYHIALARSSASTKMFVNGTQGGSTYSDTRNYNSQYAVYIGHDSNGTTSPVTGYLADIRISRGYARYTTTFTPPTAPLKTN